MNDIGILLSISAPNDVDEDRAIEVEADNVTLEDALELVRIDERTNAGHDHDAGDAEDRAHYGAMGPLIDAMAWTPSTTHPGQFKIDSVWCGGLAEDGVEWRFIPVTEAT